MKLQRQAGRSGVPAMSDRDALAALIHDGPMEPAPQHIGGQWAKDEAYRKADAILAAGWRAPNMDATKYCVECGHQYGRYEELCTACEAAGTDGAS